jgi:hypothetical protein
MLKNKWGDNKGHSGLFKKCGSKNKKLSPPQLHENSKHTIDGKPIFYNKSAGFLNHQANMAAQHGSPTWQPNMAAQHGSPTWQPNNKKLIVMTLQPFLLLQRKQQAK